MHPGVYIGSAVCKFHCNVDRFDKDITLHLQHYIRLKSSEDCHKMCFIVCHGDIGYMKYGHFEVGCAFGIIKLNELSCVCIAWTADFQKSISIHMKVLPPIDILDSQNNFFSQSICSHSSENKLSTSKNHHYSSDQFKTPLLSQSTVDSSFCGVIKGQGEVMQAMSPPYKYEGMLTLPKDHSTLAKWTGIFSVYLKILAWRIVCILYVVLYKKFTYHIA